MLRQREVLKMFAVEYIHHRRTPCKYELKINKVEG
jgi:hypothetical protein